MKKHFIAVLVLAGTLSQGMYSLYAKEPLNCPLYWGSYYETEETLHENLKKEISLAYRSLVFSGAPTTDTMVLLIATDNNLSTDKLVEFDKKLKEVQKNNNFQLSMPEDDLDELADILLDLIKGGRAKQENCGIPYWTEYWEVSEDICGAAFFDHIESEVKKLCPGNGGSIYCIPGVGRHGRVTWNNVRTGVGWTGYWKSLVGYCEEKGLWTNVQESPPIKYRTTSSVSFTINEGSDGTDYYGQLKEQTDDRVTIEGSKKKPSSKIVSPTFNSPSIYLENTPEGNVNIQINSVWNDYTNQKPAFNQSNGWNVKSNQQNISVEGNTVDHLFYELALKKVELTRNGVNFDSKEALLGFLENGNFFQNMGMTETEKQNALNYVLPRLDEANHYYLTILDNPEDVTQIDVQPSANIVQKYFAIYPTTIPVKTTGQLVYPVHEENQKFTVKNYGEIIITPEMFVLWK